MKVYVSKTTIKKARELNKCPVEMTLRRRTHKPVQVGSDITFIGDTTYTNPPSLQKFINAFDDGRTVKPNWFRLT